jgi:6-phosphogluconolactonase
VIPVETAPDAAALTMLAAERLGQWAADDLAGAPAWRIAVSGGLTPAPVFAALALQPLPWDRVHVFQVDERVVPLGDADRNSRLLAPFEKAGAAVYPMPVDDPESAFAAAGYARALQDVTGGEFDVVHLGLGDDGHTASWPPGDAVVQLGAPDDPDVAVVGPYRGHRRMTLTPPVVDRARRVLWLVSGAGKAVALARLLAGDPAIPASRVPSERALILADEAAAAGPH